MEVVLQGAADGSWSMTYIRPPGTQRPTGRTYHSLPIP